MKQTISKYGNKSRQSGWHNESVRHSLASKGIKTGKINYSRLDGLVKTKETQYAKLPQGQQGGLSADVTLSNKFNEYTRGVAVFGYIGSSGRTTTRDEILENELREQGLGGEGIATWLTSTVARHLMDPVDKNMSDTDFRKRVKEYTKNAFKDVAIWSHPDFQGTLGSSIGLKKKFHDAQFAKLARHIKVHGGPYQKSRPYPPSQEIVNVMALLKKSWRKAKQKGDIMTIKKYGKSITSGMFNAGLNFGKGWKGESTRHSLASKGIKTGGIKTKMSTIDSLMFGETMAASSMKAGQELKYAKTSLVKPQIEMDTFGVDSGQVLMTDPAYLKAFMEHYDYDKMIEFMYDENAMKAAGIEVKAESNSKEATKLANERRALYLYKVAEKAKEVAIKDLNSIKGLSKTKHSQALKEINKWFGQLKKSVRVP